MNPENDKLTNAETAVLALIAGKPKYAYEIDKIIEERQMRSWMDIAFSSIYGTLKRLEKRGLVSSELEHGENVARTTRIYKITPKGLDSLHNEIQRLLSNPKHPIAEIDLGIVNIPFLDNETVLQCLHQYENQLLETIAYLKESLTRLNPDTPIHVRAIFERPLKHMKTELSWLRDFVSKFELVSGKK